MKNYDLIKIGKLINTNFETRIYVHKKTKMNIMIIDTNNELYFDLSATFKVKDNYGIPHIIEHSLLNGSQKYDYINAYESLKEENLLNFSYAATTNYFSKYQFSSFDENSYINMCKYYFDAIFCPKFINDERVFKMNGATLLEKNTNYEYSGSCFNEQKANYANEIRDIYYTVMKRLNNEFFSYDAGGKPQNMIDLNYIDFLDFYYKNYHPSNLRLILSSNVNYEFLLEYLDEKYLCKFDKLEVNNEENNINSKIETSKIQLQLEDDFYISDTESCEKDLKVLVFPFMIELPNIKTFNLYKDLYEIFDKILLIKLKEEFKTNKINGAFLFDGEFAKKKAALFLKIKGISNDKITIAKQLVDNTFKSLFEVYKDQIYNVLLQIRNNYSKNKYVYELSPIRKIIDENRFYLECYDYRELVNQSDEEYKDYYKQCISQEYINEIELFFDKLYSNVIDNSYYLNPSITKASNVKKEIEQIVISDEQKKEAINNTIALNKLYEKRKILNNALMYKNKKIIPFEIVKKDIIIIVDVKKDNFEYEEIVLNFLLNGNSAFQNLVNYFTILNISNVVMDKKIVEMKSKYLYTQNNSKEYAVIRLAYSKNDQKDVLKLINDMINELYKMTEDNLLNITIPKYEKNNFVDGLFDIMLENVCTKDLLFNNEWKNNQNKSYGSFANPCKLDNIFLIKTGKDIENFFEIDSQKLSFEYIYVNDKGKNEVEAKDVMINNNTNFNGLIMSFKKEKNRVYIDIINELIMNYLKENIIKKNNAYNIKVRYVESINSLVYITNCDKEVEYTKKIYSNILNYLKQVNDDEIEKIKYRVFKIYNLYRLNNSLLAINLCCDELLNKYNSNYLNEIQNNLNDFNKKILKEIINNINIDDLKLISFISK